RPISGERRQRSSEVRAEPTTVIRWFGSMTSQRAIKHVFADGAMTGVIAGLATGAIDALWSWGPAAQFAPGFFARARFVLFSASTHAAAGALVGLALAGMLLVLSRASRIGDFVRFAWR